MRIDFGGAGGIAFGQRCLSALQQILFLCADGALGEAFKECHHLTLRQRTHESVDRLTVGECNDRGNRLNAHLARNRWMLVDVHLRELHFAFCGLDRFFENRRELLARAAPRRPEIHEDRLVLGLLYDVLHEALRGRLLDHVGCHRCCPAILQHF